jgi:hypothetical protein
MVNTFMTEQIHDKRFPNESPEYRAARNELIEAPKPAEAFV